MAVVQGNSAWSIELNNDDCRTPMDDPWAPNELMPGLSEVTVKLDDGKGTTYELKGGTITAMQMSDPIHVKPIVEDVVIMGGEFVPEPPPAPENEWTTGPRTPWSWETELFVAMLAICPVVYALIKGILYGLK